MDSTRTRWREDANRPFLDELPPRVRAEQLYYAMTDADLLAFVRERLPKLVFRVEHRPRCTLCRLAIVAELEKRPPRLEI